MFELKKWDWNVCMMFLLEELRKIVICYNALALLITNNMMEKLGERAFMLK